MKSIHFICRGNIYRSRLAEAYAKSLLKNGVSIHVSSSGIEADLNLVGDAAPITQQIAASENIDQYLSPTWTQVTQGHIDTNDIVIFMNKTVYQDATTFLNIPDEKTEVWSIPDKPGVYPDIKKSVDALLTKQLA